jgi:uncharacterized protein (TIGR02722 family)
MIRLFCLAWLGAVVAGTSGCAAFRASARNVDVNEEKHFDEKFDYSDMRKLTDEIVDELLASELLGEAEEAPIMMVAGLRNDTGRYIDLKSLTDRMRTRLIKSNEVRFVNESRRAELLKEQGYQAAHATPESQVMVGRQLGAKYMLSGALSEMKQRSPNQVRVSRQKLNYYKLTIEVTDLETSLISWTTDREFAREASEPLIGW